LEDFLVFLSSFKKLPDPLISTRPQKSPIFKEPFISRSVARSENESVDLTSNEVDETCNLQINIF
jgi:hypothetical protein